MADNKDARVHMLTEDEANKLCSLYDAFLTEINTILDNANLETNTKWMPSQDFRWLVKIE